MKPQYKPELLADLNAWLTSRLEQDTIRGVVGIERPVHYSRLHLLLIEKLK